MEHVDRLFLGLALGGVFSIALGRLIQILDDYYYEKQRGAMEPFRNEVVAAISEELKKGWEYGGRGW